MVVLRRGRKKYTGDRLPMGRVLSLRLKSSTFNGMVSTSIVGKDHMLRGLARGSSEKRVGAYKGCVSITDLEEKRKT